MKGDTQEFCEQLVLIFNELAPLMQEHLADYDEILPHVFMADVTRYVLAGGSQRQELVSHLDDALRIGSKDIQNMIAVSFVECIENEEDLRRVLINAHGDSLRDEWYRQHK